MYVVVAVNSQKYYVFSAAAAAAAAAGAASPVTAVAVAVVAVSAAAAVVAAAAAVDVRPASNFGPAVGYVSGYGLAWVGATDAPTSRSRPAFLRRSSSA